MKVLVAVASKHGSTREIAQSIAEELIGSGAVVDVRDAADVTDLAGYDAAVIGSAVYMGQWLSDARVLLERIADEPSGTPLWLFSSGLSDTPSKDTNSAGARALREASDRVREHRHFHGALDLKQLNIAERAVIAAARGKEGDNRDFGAIRTWARSIVEALKH